MLQLLFRSILIGQEFSLNGNIYHKVSSRTARMNGYGSRTFYIPTEQVVTPLETGVK